MLVGIALLFFRLGFWFGLMQTCVSSFVQSKNSFFFAFIAEVFACVWGRSKNFRVVPTSLSGMNLLFASKGK